MLANPLGGELVPCRWGSTMPRVMVWTPEVPPGPHPLVDMDSSLTFASPVITHRCYSWVGCFPSLTPGPYLYSWVDWRKCEHSSRSKNNNPKVASPVIKPTTTHNACTRANTHTTHIHTLTSAKLLVTKVVPIISSNTSSASRSS